ncbi:hypothetical protein PVT68_15410 [Microbulbifer bruguierae]|uniref:Uncharacterized protein n=1 Tax=Microbulbifer bruguierae TaxID=3029061 RepID=A0ABY8NDK0_9GAMM|nr:hypothetical protein [Microbulbifer bruguierae]WGL16147.1 hypothetical protein PVT68_15410 [Microbulbifer bruguierae]
MNIENGLAIPAHARKHNNQENNFQQISKQMLDTFTNAPIPAAISYSMSKGSQSRRKARAVPGISRLNTYTDGVKYLPGEVSEYTHKNG